MSFKAFLRIMRPSAGPARWLLACLFLSGWLLGACSISGSETGAPSQHARAPLPGGSTYSWGWSQRPTNSANIDQAQSGNLIYPSTGRLWYPIPISKSVESTMGNLSWYFPMHARWSLKDGREFIIERVDIDQIMRQYFQANTVQTQWQQEGRPRAKVGDFDPVLAHEIRDDSLLLKWVIVFNRTPANLRVGTGIPWKFEEVEYFVVAIKGVPTAGIDFGKRND
jgi:hypothetical protein